MTAGAEILLDTNILLYAYDASDPVRQRAARQVVILAARSAGGAVSTQVMAEFYVNATRKLPVPLAPERAARVLQLLCRLFRVFVATPDVVCEAARAARVYRLHFWDAMIWAAARLNGASVVLTEDLPGVGDVEGITWVNPLALDADELNRLLAPRTSA